MTESYWVIPKENAIKTPYAIIREQAQSLTLQTKGKVVGEIFRQNEGGEIHILLFASVPSMNNYRFTILEAFHDASLYPASIIPFYHSSPINCENQENFVSALKEAIGNQKTTKIITALIAQALDKTDEELDDNIPF